MRDELSQKRIVIIGGGFGGVRTALALSKKKLDAKILLLTDKPYMEYYAALYRVVAGHSPMEVCVPYADMFEGTDIEVVIDRVSGVDMQYKTVRGTSGFNYRYDSLVIAVGAETAYFTIPGMQELSYGMKSVHEALELKRHLHEVFEVAKRSQNEDKVASAHIVVIGGGASGVELAGELAFYARDMAEKHGLPRSLVSIDLVEAMPRLLPLLPEKVSARVLTRLQSIGVNVLLNRAVVREDLENVYLKDMQMRTKTVVWTAGLKPSSLLGLVEGLQKDKRGRAEVDEFLRAKGQRNVYVIGDAAATRYSGMAQTAFHDGEYVADIIARGVRGQTLYSYTPKAPAYAVPVGPGWATVVIGSVAVYGRIGWIIRRVADLKVFLSLLSPAKAIRTFLSGETLIETCPVCEEKECMC